MLKCFYILIWITVFKLCFCHRRMGLGNDSILGKKYLVYFVKSPYSNGDDDAWICAGAIVSPTQILTAAACLVEINNIYVIAGYKKYIHGRDIEKDKCTSTWKKRIVKISVPKEYSKSTGKQLEWMNVDIGVATVQEPYNFDDQSYLTHCSYVPESILINQDKEIEVEKTRAIALGWGGEKNEESDEIVKENPKPQLLQEATTTIINNTFCADLVAKNGSKELVNKYLLCASGNGFLGEDADETTSDPIMEEFSISNVSIPNNSTKSGSTTKSVDSGLKSTNISLISKQIIQGDDISSRKSSLPETCQNDHGGPLVAWVGTNETILGVALNGICNPNFDCVGPRIYVSTASTTDIIKCLLETNETRRKTCNDQMDDKRYQVNDIEIKWPEESKNNTTSPLKVQQSPSNRRQLDNEETPLQIRQTRDLRDYEDHKYQQNYPRTILNDNSQEIQPYGNQQDPRANPQENLRKHLFDSTEEIELDFMQAYARAHSQETLHDNSTENHQASDTQFNPNYTQQNLPEADQTGSAGQTQHQPQVESQYQSEPKSDNQSQSQLLALAQSNNQKLMDIYSHLKIASFVEPQNQTEPPINNEESISNQPQQEINNNPQISTLIPLEMESFMPSQGDSYKQPQAGVLKPRPVKTINQALKNVFKLPLSEQLPSLDLPFNVPQAESFKDTGYQQSQPELSRATQNSNKEPTQSPYDHMKMSLKPPPTESYNPLDIIMSENQQEDDTLEHLMEEPYNPSIVDRLKQSSVDPYIPDPGNLGLVLPDEQPDLSQLIGPSNVQPSPSYPSRVQNILRLNDQDFNSSQADASAEIFQQLFSPMQDTKTDPWSQFLVTTEEILKFEDLYKKINDGKDEKSSGQDDEIQLGPVEGVAEQTDASGFMNEGLKHDVQLRRQKPLEYPDYI